MNRESIVTVARSFLNTPFRHQGRIHSSNTSDCAGLIIAICITCSLKSKIKYRGSYIPISDFDTIEYRESSSGHLLLSILHKTMHKINNANRNIGDVLAFRFNNNTLHVGIQSYSNHIIHTLKSTNKVVEHPLNDFWLDKLCHTFLFEDLRS